MSKKKNNKSLFKRIERVYAKNGLVYAVDKNGKEIKMDIKTAAERAATINMSKYPPDMQDLIKKRNILVEKIIQAIYEARRQIEQPKTKAENYITKLLHHKDEDGALIVPTKDQDLQTYLFQYFTLSEHEILKIMESIRKDLVPMVLAEKHQERVSLPEFQDKLIQKKV